MPHADFEHQVPSIFVASLSHRRLSRGVIRRELLPAIANRATSAIRKDRRPIQTSRAEATSFVICGNKLFRWLSFDELRRHGVIFRSRSRGHWLIFAQRFQKS